MARLLWTHGRRGRELGAARNGPSSCTRCSRASRSSTCARAASARTAATSRSRRTRLWLYPTAEHQKPELLKEPYRHWIDLAHAAPVGEPITLEGWADVVKVATITEPEELDAIASKLIWTPDYAASRLSWKHRDPLWVLALRVHRLLEPVTVPWADDYGGCTSWVELDGLPDDPASLPSEPGALRRRVRGPAQGRGRGPPVAHRRGA